MPFLYPTLSHFDTVFHQRANAQIEVQESAISNRPAPTTMRAVVVFSLLVAAATLTSMAQAAAIKHEARAAAIKREEAKNNNQYPWYYWNQDGQQQGQYPYYMFCGAEGVSSLNMLSLSVVGLTALAFTGIPQVSRPQ